MRKALFILALVACSGCVSAGASVKGIGKHPVRIIIEVGQPTPTPTPGGAK